MQLVAAEPNKSVEHLPDGAPGDPSAEKWLVRGKSRHLMILEATDCDQDKSAACLRHSKMSGIDNSEPDTILSPAQLPHHEPETVLTRELWYVLHDYTSRLKEIHERNDTSHEAVALVVGSTILGAHGREGLARGANRKNIRSNSETRASLELRWGDFQEVRRDGRDFWVIGGVASDRIWI